MKWTHCALLAAVVLGTITADFTTNATTMIKLTNADLALLADAVVVARVEEVRTERATDTAMIYTRATLDVEESWKGKIAESSYIDVTTVGGVLDGRRAYVAGVPIFLRNETTLLYLSWNDQRKRWDVLSWQQGKYTVLQKADGSRFARRVPLKMEHSGLDITDDAVKDKLVVDDAAQPLGELRFNLERTLADHAKNGGGDPWELPKYKGIGR